MPYKVIFHKQMTLILHYFRTALKNLIIVIELKHTDSNELKDAIEP